MSTRLITSVTPTPPDFGLPPLPSLENLVAVAAQISSLDEHPTETALRAICLFSECRTVLIRARKAAATVRFEEYRASEIREIDQKFMESLEPCDDDPSGAVTLDSFLKVCKCGTKISTRNANWRGFARFYVEMREIIDGTQDRCGLSGLELKAAGEEMANFYEVNGIGRDYVLFTRDLFSAFLMENKGRDVEAKAEKSKRARINLPVCRKAVNKQKLTNEDNEVLKDMTGDEVEAAVKKLRKDNELGQNGVGLLNAAIADASREKSAQPRVSKKTPKA